MSHIMFNDLGAVELATAWLADLLVNGATIRLGKNNYTPTDSDVLASFTEADFDGYAGVALSGGAVANLGSGLGARIDWDPVSWTPSGGATPNDIYTWYVTDSANTICYFAGAMDTLPSPMHSGADSITIPPRFFTKSIF